METFWLHSLCKSKKDQGCVFQDIKQDGRVASAFPNNIDFAGCLIGTIKDNSQSVYLLSASKYQ
jgi:hypothetical protein